MMDAEFLSVAAQGFSVPDSISQLYHIAPHDSCDGHRESLTSLIIRTARMHAISPRDMIFHVSGQHFEEIAAICKGTFYRHYSAPTNGLGRYARLFAHAFAHLAAHPDLTHHTMLPLANVLASQGSPVIHQGQRWCPLCFETMLESGTDVYRPLLWSLAAVENCHVHGMRLEAHCPHCGEFQPIIPRWPDMAFCDFCRGALFGAQGTAPQPSCAPWDSCQSWNIAACVDLVAHLHEINAQTALENFKAILNIAITKLCEGNRAKFCRQIGLSIYALGKILRNENKPTFETLLRIGYVLDLPPSQLLIEHKRPQPERLHIARQIQTPKRSWQRNTAAHEEEVIAKHLHSPAPPSIREIAGSIFMTRGGLKYRHPGLHSSIVEKRRTELTKRAQKKSEERKTYLRDFVAQVVGAGRFPSKDLVEEALRLKGWSLLRPELRQCYHEMLMELTQVSQRPHMT